MARLLTNKVTQIRVQVISSLDLDLIFDRELDMNMIISNQNVPVLLVYSIRVGGERKSKNSFGKVNIWSV